MGRRRRVRSVRGGGFFESAHRGPRKLAALELRAQQLTVEAVRGASRAAAVGAVRRITTDLGPLIEQLAARCQLTVAGPLPARPAPRVRRVGDRRVKVTGRVF
ncbi:hypothetical protein AB0H83_36670 [Dactylosporangium sp. NPDC050688]|uniref:hypothetical protein n=1 Tax=Dactylosporangium sp. NPDC050688 TaxID=3157217 RepID=UPI0033D8256F